MLPKRSKTDIKTLVIASLGSSLEFYDFVIYVFFAQMIATIFFNTTSTISGLLISFSVFASGYVARFVGGIIFSHFGDKRGRKNAFATTILLMAAPTFMIGLLPTYSQAGLLASLLLISCRIIQGLAIGGEIPGAITFVYEHVLKSKRGLACGILFCGTTIGTFLGSSVAALCFAFMSSSTLHSWGWRIPFLIGGVLGWISAYIRRYLKETPLFLNLRKEHIKYPALNIIKAHKYKWLQSASAIWAIAVAISIYLLFLPTYLHVYDQFDSMIILMMNSLAVLMNAILIMGAGKLSDIIGARKMLNISLIILIIGSYPIFANFAPGNYTAIYLCYLFIGIANAAGAASGIVLLAASFPTKIRYSGVALGYNLALGVLGGFTPLIVTALIQYTGQKTAPAFYMMLVASIALILSLLHKKGSDALH
jgi:MFS family permease